MRHGARIALAVSLVALGGCSATDTIPPGEPVAHVLAFSGAGYLNKRDPAKVAEFLAAAGYASEEAYYADVVARMRELGAAAARAEMWYVGNGVFAAQGSLYQAMTAEAFELVGQFNPTPQFEVPDPAFEPALDALVRGHPEIRAWQIGNEPDLTWQDHRRYAPFFLRAQPVIRAACPSCAILLAGISNQYASGENLVRYGEILDAIAAAGLERPFDVFDFHYYKELPSRAEIEAAASTYRGLLAARGLSGGVSLWCTETATYTGDPSAPDLDPRTETEQARDLVRLVAWMTAAGVQRLFHWTVVESWGSPVMPGFFEQMGLVYNGLGDEPAPGMGGVEKKAYTTYGLLARALTGVTGAARVSDGVYRLDREAGGPAFLVWAEAGGDIVLSGIPGEVARVKDLVPDDTGVVTVREMPLVSGQAAIAVGELPLLVTGGSSALAGGQP
jgi:hypothetical protein